MQSSRSFKALLLASGSLLAKVSGLASAVILARYLSKEDYSTYRQALLAYGTAAPLLALGLPKALYYFLPGEKKRPGGIFLENLLLLVLMGAIFMIGLWLGGAELLAGRFNNPDLAATLLIFAPFALFMLPQGAFSACMMGRDRVYWVAIAEPLGKVMMTLIVIIAAFTLGGSRGPIIGAVIGSALLFVPLTGLMFHACRGGDWTVTGKGMMNQLSYSIPLGFAAMVGTMAGNLDKIVVSSLGTPGEFAVYVNGAMHLPIVGIITGSVVSVLLPDMAACFKKGEYEKAIGMWQRAAVKCGLFLVPAGILLMGLAPEFVVMLYGQRYEESALPFALYAMLVPVGSISFGSALLAAGRAKLVLAQAIGALVLNLIFTLVAVSCFGIFAAAAATVASYYLWGISSNTYFIARVYRIHWAHVIPVGPLLRIVCISIVAGICCLLPPVFEGSPVLRLLIMGFAFGGIVLLCYLRSGLVDKEDFERVFRRLVHRSPSR